MAIPVWSSPTGLVGVREFDQGVMTSLGGVPFTDTKHPCYSVPVPYPNGQIINVSAYFDQPEPIFKYEVYPFITIHREDMALAMHRWMNVGQLEYRSGVSGTQGVINGVSGYFQHQSKIQAFPYDIPYTITCFDRYEQRVQPILLYILKHFPPLGKLVVFDSLGLQRTYEAYQEGSIVNMQELIDPVTRARGYAISIRVEGELDLVDSPPFVADSVTGVDLYLHRM